MEQIVDIPVPAGGLHDLLVPGGSSSSAVSCGKGFFRNVPRGKKIPKSAASPSPRGPPGRAPGLQRLGALWLMTALPLGVSTRMTMATCGAEFVCVLVEHSHLAYPTAAAVGTLRWWCESWLVLEPPRYTFMAL